MWACPGLWSRHSLEPWGRGQAPWEQCVGLQAGPVHGGSLEGLGSPSTGSLDRSQGLRAEHPPLPWDLPVVMCVCWAFF